MAEVLIIVEHTGIRRLRFPTNGEPWFGHGALGGPHTMRRLEDQGLPGDVPDVVDSLLVMEPAQRRGALRLEGTRLHDDPQLLGTHVATLRGLWEAFGWSLVVDPQLQGKPDRWPLAPRSPPIQAREAHRLWEHLRGWPLPPPYRPTARDTDLLMHTQTAHALDVHLYDDLPVLVRERHPSGADAYGTCFAFGCAVAADRLDGDELSDEDASRWLRPAVVVDWSLLFVDPDPLAVQLAQHNGLGVEENLQNLGEALLIEQRRYGSTGDLGRWMQALGKTEVADVVLEVRRLFHDAGMA